MKAQAAIEFMAILGFVLFFFTVFAIVINNNIVDKNKEKEEIIVKNLALSIQDEINLATKASNGYMRNFTVDKKILGREYYLNITGDQIYIETNRVAISLQIKNVTGYIRKGKNAIKKENDQVYLNI